MTTTKHTAYPCPSCGSLNNALSSAHAQPKPGDVALCAYCFAVLHLGPQLQLVWMTFVQWHDLSLDQRNLLCTYAGLLAMRKWKDDPGGPLPSPAVRLRGLQ